MAKNKGKKKNKYAVQGKKKAKKKYAVKGRTKVVDEVKDKEKSIEEKFYWSRALLGLLSAIIGSGIFHIVGWWMLLFLGVSILVFPFIMSFVVFRLEYIKDKWDWKNILKTGIGAHFFLFMLLSTALHTLYVLPDYQANFDNPADSRDLYAKDGVLFVADGQNGLLCLDLEVGRTLLGQYHTKGDAIAVIIEGNMAFVSEESNGFEIIDISDPSDPKWIATFDTPGQAKEIFVSENYAYVADREGGLIIVDISTPSNPIQIANYATEDKFVSVFVDNKTAYIGVRDQGLLLLNITNPAIPTKISNITTLGQANGLFVDEDYVYMADGDKGLHLIDVSTPTAPVNISTYKTGSVALDVVVIGQMAFVGYGKEGLLFINYESPAEPDKEDHYNTLGEGNNIFVSEDYVYIADGGRGIEKVSIDNPAPSPVQQTSKANTISFGWTWLGVSFVVIFMLVFKVRKTRKKDE